MTSVVIGGLVFDQIVRGVMRPVLSGGCLDDRLISSSVGLKHPHKSRDFKLELRIDGRGVVERV